MGNATTLTAGLVTRPDPTKDRAGKPVPEHIAAVLSVLSILIEYGRHLTATVEHRAIWRGFATIAQFFGTAAMPVILAHIHRGLMRVLTLEQMPDELRRYLPSLNVENDLFQEGRPFAAACNNTNAVAWPVAGAGPRAATPPDPSGRPNEAQHGALAPHFRLLIVGGSDRPVESSAQFLRGLQRQLDRRPRTGV
jgi:hypothetical protein